MSEYRLLIFDWDGTLIDSQARIVNCLQQAAAAVGLAVPESNSCRNVIGLELSAACRRLQPGVEDGALAAYVSAYRSHYLEKDQTPELLFPGTEAVLEQLAAAGYRMAIATGKSRRGLDRALAHTGLAPHFAASRCADECCSKPHPEMVLSLLENLGEEAARTLVIGDSEYDMLMAANAGVERLAVSYGVQEAARLLAHGPVGLIDDIRDLPGLLRG